MAKKVLVYSTPICPMCEKAKAFLRENSVEYEEMDVSSDKRLADELVEKTGQRSVPVLDIGGAVVIGFNKEKILEALEE